MFISVKNAKFIQCAFRFLFRLPFFFLHVFYCFVPKARVLDHFEWSASSVLVLLSVSPALYPSAFNIDFFSGLCFYSAVVCFLRFARILVLLGCCYIHSIFLSLTLNIHIFISPHSYNQRRPIQKEFTRICNNVYSLFFFYLFIFVSTQTS